MAATSRQIFRAWVFCRCVERQVDLLPDVNLTGHAHNRTRRRPRVNRMLGESAFAWLPPELFHEPVSIKAVTFRPVPKADPATPDDERNI